MNPQVDPKLSQAAMQRGTLILSVMLAAAWFAPARAAAATCESLSSLALPDTTITSAETVKAGAFTMPSTLAANPNPPGMPAPVFGDLPAFCRVTATLKPTPDSDIKVEIWLPVDGWNNKFQAVGNGGLAGVISYPALADALRGGYATGSTDTGHVGNRGEFALGHPEKLVDYAYRSEHEMTVKAKSVIEAYYGKPARYSYWNSCSTGGKQGLTEAQRYPADFDGIIAGAPANYFTHLAAAALSVSKDVHEDPDSYIPPEKYPVIHEAVLAACDRLDGVKDGVLDDPRRCRFDISSLECKEEDAGDCLTTKQVEAARTIYAPVVNPMTGEKIYPGLQPGSELGWAGLAGPKPFNGSNDIYRYIVFKNPDWNYLKLDLGADVTLADKVDGGENNAISPDLKAFFAHGGKLLMYHGWSDPLIAPESSINYYESVVEATGGAEKTVASARLFMVPGMGHCHGGDGTDDFDKVAVIEQWVEKGKAPDQIIASHSKDGKVQRTRPLCPYPQVAKYKSSGSTDDAANFACAAQ